MSDIPTAGRISIAIAIENRRLTTENERLREIVAKCNVQIKELLKVKKVAENINVITKSGPAGYTMEVFGHEAVYQAVSDYAAWEKDNA